MPSTKRCRSWAPGPAADRSVRRRSEHSIVSDHGSAMFVAEHDFLEVGDSVDGLRLLIWLWAR
jgi:hypothetical protein